MPEFVTIDSPDLSEADERTLDFVWEDLLSGGWLDDESEGVAVQESKGHSRRIPRGTKLAEVLRDFFTRQAKDVASQAAEMLGALTEGLLECGGEGGMPGPCPTKDGSDKSQNPRHATQEEVSASWDRQSDEGEKASVAKHTDELNRLQSGEQPRDNFERMNWKDKPRRIAELKNMIKASSARIGHRNRSSDAAIYKFKMGDAIRSGAFLKESITEDQDSRSFVLASEWDDDLAMSAKPYIELYFKKEAQAVKARVGASANYWEVVNPKLSEAVDQLSLKFARSTNRTTSMELSRALDELREQFREGLLAGDPLPELTKRVQSVFDTAEKGRAITIAHTEASRATHNAQVLAGEASGVVQGFRVLVSDDACEICLAIAESNPEVPLGGTFAIVGNNPEYSDVKFPPFHVGCLCSITEILDNELRPESGDVLNLPGDLQDD